MPIIPGGAVFRNDESAAQAGSRYWPLSMTSQVTIPPLPSWFETRPLESGSGESGRFIFSNLARGFAELTIERKSFDRLAGNYNRYTADGSNDNRAAAGLQFPVRLAF